MKQISDAWIRNKYLNLIIEGLMKYVSRWLSLNLGTLTLTLTSVPISKYYNVHFLN